MVLCLNLASSRAWGSQSAVLLQWIRKHVLSWKNNVSHDDSDLDDDALDDDFDDVVDDESAMAEAAQQEARQSTRDLAAASLVYVPAWIPPIGVARWCVADWIAALTSMGLLVSSLREHRSTVRHTTT